MNAGTQKRRLGGEGSRRAILFFLSGAGAWIFEKRRMSLLRAQMAWEEPLPPSLDFFGPPKPPSPSLA
jgi:hypothetical protein